MQPFNTHEKRLFVQMYVAAHIGARGLVNDLDFDNARRWAVQAWDNALAAGLIQDHDAEPVSEVTE